MLTSFGNEVSAGTSEMARSFTRSPSKSPTASCDTSPVVEMVNGLSASVPLPTKRSTSSSVLLAATTSGRPSPFKSAMAPSVQTPVVFCTLRT